MSTFQIEQTPLWLDIRKIINSGSKPIKFEINGMLHTEKEDIPVLKIVSIDVVRDYVKNTGDHIRLEFKMALGDYMVRLYPYRANLEFSIKKIQLEEISGNKEKNTNISIERYKAIFLMDENPNTGSSQIDANDTESINKMNIVDVKLQLLDRAIEPLRIKTVSGIFRQVTQKQVIYNLLAGESNKVLVEGKPCIDGINIVQPDNDDIKQHVVIQSGLNIVSVPSHLQEHAGGVYTAGIGTYLQYFKNKKIWFVYPLYNVNRFDGNVDKVIFYSLPQEKFQGMDRTYYKEGSVTKILVTSNRQYKDSADVDFMNKGVGFRLADANSFMKKPVELTAAGPVGKRANLNYEVSLIDRKDGLNYAPISDNKISNNPYVEYSKVLARTVARIDLVWENADYSMIHPGMPCKYIFLSKDKPVELKGVILFIHALTSLQGNGITNNVYKTICQISIVVENYSSTPTLPLTKPAGVF